MLKKGQKPIIEACAVADSMSAISILNLMICLSSSAIVNSTVVPFNIYNAKSGFACKIEASPGW